MNYTLSHIARILGTAPIASERVIENLSLDSRKAYSPLNTIFFALQGPRRDGHLFIPELYKKGLRAFVVSEQLDGQAFPEAEFLRVPDTLQALQRLAIHHRKQFDIPVVGITGSNGKTIVKEWLYQVLHERYSVVRSPKSYNSQIGVPLSVWQMNEQHTLGIFEAGISQPGEMEKLAAIIQPELGILTNIGEAHSEGFKNRIQKLEEKLKLFDHCKVLIGRDTDLGNYKRSMNGEAGRPTLLTWGTDAANDLQVKHILRQERQTILTLCPGGAEREIIIPFTDDASIENAITVYMAALQLGLEHDFIAGQMKTLQPVNMRLELKKGINQCILINDSYSADVNSLQIALDFLAQQSHGASKTVILSDLLQSGKDDQHLYGSILDALYKRGVGRLIGIGEHISKALHAHMPVLPGGLRLELYPSTEAYIRQFLSSQFREETVLIKGARIFGFEQIVQLLEQKVHQTVLEINLNAIVHNLNVYRQQLDPKTKVMAMVKAFAYGSGGAEIAGILQYHQVDYLGVAYADEGVELRKTGVDLPIMVMNPEEAAFESIVSHNLEPDIYSFEVLHAFETFLESEGLKNYPVHIEIETGMNRLGFAMEEIEQLAKRLAKSSLIKVQSVFSHLASSEDAGDDDFTLVQFARYQQAVSMLSNSLPHSFIRHLANTAAIFRFPELQLDMVRLGIGMYGIDSAQTHQSQLQPAASLKTTIAQLKHLKKGESVSYNRRGIVNRDSIIATVRIGYADGYSRRLGKGVGRMLVNGQIAPVIGSVCMDMTMIDVTDIPEIQEGDEVIVFGKDLPVQQIAEWAGTIPYEIMTGISQRVKRVYFEE